MGWDGTAQLRNFGLGGSAVVARTKHFLRFFQPFQPGFDIGCGVAAGDEFGEVAHLFGGDAQRVQGLGFEVVQVVHALFEFLGVVVQLLVQRGGRCGAGRGLGQAAAKLQQLLLGRAAAQRCVGLQMGQAALQLDFFLQHHAQAGVGDGF